MDVVSESLLSPVLQEAFTCYLSFLFDTKKLQESTIPRTNTSSEVTADPTSYRYFESRVSSTELCLQYLNRISRSVQPLIAEYSNQSSHLRRSIEVQYQLFDTFQYGEVEDPFLETYPERFVRPVTSPASPPRRDLERGREETMAGPPHRRSSHSQAADRSSSTKPQSRSLSRAPKPAGEKTPSTVASSSKTHTPFSTAGTVVGSPFISLYPFAAARRRFSNNTSNSGQTTHDEGTSSAPRSSRPLYQRDKRSAEDERFARRVQVEERRRKDEQERSLAHTRRLAEEWEREEKARIEAQERFARNLEKEERRRLERVERDREAARKAQEGQDWEMAAIAQETEAMRAEERRRREHAEKQRHKEQDSRSKTEAHRKLEVERNRVTTEERRRREAQNNAEMLRKQREGLRRKAVAKRVDCVSCMEPGDSKDMVALSCKHSYCGECIKAAFKSSYKSRSPFKCCAKIIDPSQLPGISTRLPASFLQKYSLLLLELSTPNPKYCSSPTCSLFLPPSTLHGSIGTCSCGTRTCILCTKPEHGGICKEDTDGKKLEEMGKEKGWRMCSGCKAMIERTEGCLHITCRCGAEWCYACGREWKVCGSACSRS